MLRATVDLWGQTGNMPMTTVIRNPAPGIYRVTVLQKCASPVGSGTLTTYIMWNDASGMQYASPATPLALTP